MIRQLINGKAYDWSSVDIGIPGLESIEPTKVSYDGEKELEIIYGKSGESRGYGTGNRKNNFSLSMLREDYNELVRVWKANGYKALQDYIIPKITVSYADEGAETTVDVINKVVLNKASMSASQGDKSMAVELTGVVFGKITTNGLQI